MEPQRKKYSRGPTEVDRSVGDQIRRRRIILGLSQEKLADGLGITFQQVQKYERGSNRVSASRLYQTARLLDEPISYFFENLDGDAEIPSLGSGKDLPGDMWDRKETLNLLRFYYGIGDEGLRDQLRDILKGIAFAKL